MAPLWQLSETCQVQVVNLVFWIAPQVCLQLLSPSLLGQLHAPAGQLPTCKPVCLMPAAAAFAAGMRLPLMVHSPCSCARSALAAMLQDTRARMHRLPGNIQRGRCQALY